MKPSSEGQHKNESEENKMYKDIETNEIVTKEQLMQEYEENYTEEERSEYTFGQYLHNCQTYAGGTLEEIQK